MTVFQCVQQLVGQIRLHQHIALQRHFAWSLKPLHGNSGMTSVRRREGGHLCKDMCGMCNPIHVCVFLRKAIDFFAPGKETVSEFNVKQLAMMQS